MNVNSVGSSSSFSVSASTNKGMSGLVSGLDTEGMVEQMLSGTQSKIDKQNQLKQQTVWKQEQYRDCITQINDFKGKYFDFLYSQTNLLSTEFYNQMSATTKSNAFNISATANALTGNTRVNVGQLATHSSLKSGSQISGDLTGKLDLNALDRKVVFQIDGQKVTVDLNNVVEDGGNDAESRNNFIMTKINNELTNAGIDPDDVKASVEGGRLVFNGSKQVTVSGDSTGLGLQMIGMSAGNTSSKVDNTSFKLSGQLNAEANLEFTIALNGKTGKKITLDWDSLQANGYSEGASAADKQQAIFKTIEDKMKLAFGANTKFTGNADGTLKFSADNGQDIVISGGKASMDLFGIKSGQSNALNLGMQLKNLNFAEPLQGDIFTFKINGVEITARGSESLATVMSRINESDAGVKVTYNKMEDRFTIQNSNSGKGFDIEMSQSEGNLLTALFGKQNGTDIVDSSSSAASHYLVKNNLIGTKTLAAGDTVVDKNTKNTATGLLNLSVNKKKITLTTKGGTTEEILKELNDQLLNAYGKTDDGDQALEFELKNGKVQLNVRNNATVVMGEKESGSSANIKDLGVLFGFANEQSNLVHSVNVDETTLEDVGLGGLAGLTLTGTGGSLAVNANTTLKDLQDLGIYDLDKGVLKITGISGPPDAAQSEALKSAFYTDTFDFGNGTQTVDKTDPKVYTAGQNALIEIDGVWTERTDNSFTINGLNFELLETTGTISKDADGNYLDASNNLVTDLNDIAFTANAQGTATISTTRNTEVVFDAFKTFMEDYNKLIEDLNKYTHAEPDYKDYPPLTAAQKNEMSDREIELWEEKAKTGLLRNDTAINSFLTSMRQALYKTASANGVPLYDMGIETSSEVKDYGKLVFSDGTGQKFKQYLNTNAEDVMELFTTAGTGIGHLMKDAIDKAARVSSASPGSLVSIAGYKSSGMEKNNTLQRRINDINDKLENLSERYEMERQRYWNQFNAMEQAISNMNSQSSWLMSAFQ